MKKTLIVAMTAGAVIVLSVFIWDGSLGSRSAGDWPQWCGRPDRNMVSDATGLPDWFDAIEDTNSSTGKLRNVRWVARLGMDTYGSPVISRGKVFVGGCAHDTGGQKAMGELWCFNESDGQLIWQFRSPYLHGLYNKSWGMTSTPTVEGNRVYLLGHLGEVLCLNADGLAGGNTGPFQDEALLLDADRQVVKREIAPDGNRIVEYTPGTPGHLLATDADIIWRFDMIKEVRCWPFNALNACPIVRGDYLYVATCSIYSRSAYCRGEVDTADKEIAVWKEATGRTTYESPSLIVLDKHTGKLLAEDDTGVFEETFHGAHSSPALGVVNGRDLIFMGGGNGTCYAFDPDFVPGRGGKPGILRTVWKFNCVDPSTYDTGSQNKRPQGPVEIVATPVFHKGRVYVAVGNDLSFNGSAAPQGRLVCIDATGAGDITQSGKVWSFDDIRSSCSTVAIRDGLLYTADVGGNVYCLDADTGRLYWKYKTNPVWSLPWPPTARCMLRRAAKDFSFSPRGRR